MHHRSLVLAAMLAVAPIPAMADTYFAVVTRTITPGQARPGVSIDADDGLGQRYLSLVDADVRWHLDPETALPLSSLTVGTRIRVKGLYYSAETVDVVGLGPFEMMFAVEEWVIESCGNRPDKALRPGQVTTIEAMGSSSHFVREAVTKGLRERGMAELKLLAWARHSRDREVRARAEILLAALGWMP